MFSLEGLEASFRRKAVVRPSALSQLFFEKVGGALLFLSLVFNSRRFCPCSYKRNMLQDRRILEVFFFY